MAAAEKAIEFLLQNPEYIQKPINHSTSSSLSSPTLCAAADQDSANIKNDLSDDEDNENENALNSIEILFIKIKKNKSL